MLGSVQGHMTQHATAPLQAATLPLALPLARGTPGNIHPQPPHKQGSKTPATRGPPLHACMHSAIACRPSSMHGGVRHWLHLSALPDTSIPLVHRPLCAVDMCDRATDLLSCQHSRDTFDVLHVSSTSPVPARQLIPHRPRCLSLYTPHRDRPGRCSRRPWCLHKL